MDAVELKGNTGTYRIDFGTNAMCRIEEHFNDGRTCEEILDAILTRPKTMIREIRTLVQSFLVEPKNPTAEQTGAIIDDIGGPAVFIAALQQSRQMRELAFVTADPGTLANDSPKSDDAPAVN